MNTLDYILKLLSIPSPTGYTKEIIEYISNELSDMGYNYEINNKGSLIVKVKGKNTNKSRLVTAHIDTLGAMVKEIKPNGRLKLYLIGGFAYNSIEGENCIIHSRNKKYSGTILLHQSSVHVYKEARTLERNENTMEIRIDEKVFNSQDVKNLGIEVGDFISFDTRTIITDSGFIKSRHLDDKISAGIMLNLLKKYKEENISLENTTYFYFSNNEEIGYGGNSNITEEVVEYLAVDMGALGDGQNSDEYTVSICAKDSSGPYNFELREKLIDLCVKNNIKYKVDIYPYYGSDASSAIRSGADIKHGLIGAGVESSHSYERSHIDSIKETEKLLDIYIRSNIK